jgi:hypothetical protein
LGAAVLAWWRASSGITGALRVAWPLVLPCAFAFASVAAFGVVQGDPARVVAFPGSLVSARVTNLPPDHLFPVGVAQVFQHGGDLEQPHIGGPWDLTDRTPLAGAATASVLSASGTTLPTRPMWELPRAELVPEVRDHHGYWFAHLVLVFFNCFVVVGIAAFAWSIFGRRAATVAALVAAVNPYVFTHEFFTWPKMLAAYFVLLHWVLVRERRLPVLAGVLAGLAYLSHPLAGLFVVPSLVVLLVRDARRGLRALGGVLGVVLPWQVWTAAEAHPSRLLTYPLGYTMRHPNHFGTELSNAWNAFTAAGLGHALQVRWDEIYYSLVPIDVARNFATLPAGCDCISAAEAWFTIHDRTVPGTVLYALCPFVVYGLFQWHRRARWEPAWMLGGGVVPILLFWGVAGRGLGADVLQPLGAALVAVGGGGLVLVGRRRWRVAGSALLVIESASVVWWGLFAQRPAAASSDVVLAVALWLAPALLLLAVVWRGAPRETAKARRGPRAANGPVRTVPE